MINISENKIGDLKYLLCTPIGFKADKKYPTIIHFHGSDDTTVFAEESRKMVNAVTQKGGSAKLTEYDGVKHNCWDPTYSNPEIYSWLLEE